MEWVMAAAWPDPRHRADPAFAGAHLMHHIHHHYHNEPDHEVLARLAVIEQKLDLMETNIMAAIDTLKTDIAALIAEATADITAAVAQAQAASNDPAIDALDQTVTQATKTLHDTFASVTGTPVPATPAAGA
jgi:hypothetical protein